MIVRFACVSVIRHWPPRLAQVCCAASALVEMETTLLPSMEVSAVIPAVNLLYDRVKRLLQILHSLGVMKTRFNVISRL